MPSQAKQIIKVPGFSYRGFDVPALDMSTELIGNLGAGEPAYKLAPQSAPLATRAGLYIVGRDLSFGESDAEALPTDVKEAGKLVYSDCQARKGRGVWHKDGVLFEPEATIKGSVRPGDDYVAARFFKDIEGFEQEGDAWKIMPSSETREEKTWVPYGDGRYIVPTMDGAYNPITGTPFETIADKGKAIKRWMDAGLTKEQAENELSRFYRTAKDVRAVDSWSSDVNGPLGVSLGGEPWGRGSCIGSLAVNSPAERSEAPKNTGFRLVTEADYKAFEVDREKLESIRKAVE